MFGETLLPSLFSTPCRLVTTLLMTNANMHAACETPRWTECKG